MLLILSSLVLESQIQTLHAAVATAVEAVNARGNTVAARLQDIPNHIREIAFHRVHRGAAVALAVVQTLSGNDLRILHPIFPEGEAWEDFEELVDDISVVATTIGDEVNVDDVINNVFTVCWHSLAYMNYSTSA